ncbi:MULTISPECIES: NADH:flavin oxidoreductase [unclassified Desulfovibrio]|uniref:NADH:flavin oxidoreductase n=1 Tax=unclassified Desulfovibrio TaxID=2593640 RepID=UPI0013ED8863|nr:MULTISPECIES: NADH:flavin oxidoreductase [unclassified Desulfovibrio]
MKELFQPFEARNLKAKNRLVRSATWENLATPEGGICANSYGLYDELAAGGVGTIITGFTSVDAHDRYFGGMMRLCDDALIPEYQKLTDIIHKHGVSVLTQLALGAYYAKGPDGRYREVEIDAMSTGEVERMVGLFVAAGARAARAGFDGAQIHAAHFFFLSRFISPAVNHRHDQYGGSVAGRARVLVDILEGIRREAPGLHISVKLNSSDFLPGGLTEADALETGRLLAAHGIDSIEVSGNGTSRTGIRGPNDEAYFGMFAMRLAEMVDVPVILVGGLRSKKVMELLLRTSNIALLSLSRPLIRQPGLPKLFQSGQADKADCISCNACYRTDGHTCVFTPTPKWLCEN